MGDDISFQCSRLSLFPTELFDLSAFAFCLLSFHIPFKIHQRFRQHQTNNFANPVTLNVFSPVHLTQQEAVNVEEVSAGKRLGSGKRIDYAF